MKRPGSMILKHCKYKKAQSSLDGFANPDIKFLKNSKEQKVIAIISQTLANKVMISIWILNSTASTLLFFSNKTHIKQNIK